MNGQVDRRKDIYTDELTEGYTNRQMDKEKEEMDKQTKIIGKI